MDFRLSRDSAKYNTIQFIYICICYVFVLLLMCLPCMFCSFIDRRLIAGGKDNLIYWLSRAVLTVLLSLGLQLIDSCPYSFDVEMCLFSWVWVLFFRKKRLFSFFLPLSSIFSVLGCSKQNLPQYSVSVSCILPGGSAELFRKSF